jgi:epoxyqueuosine reductase
MKCLGKEQLSTHQIVDWGYTEESRPQSWDVFDQWTDEGKAAPLKYLQDHRKQLRRDIKEFFPEFQSALVFLFSYREDRLAWQNFYQSDHSNQLRMASYALAFDGLDYHQWIRTRLEMLGGELSKEQCDLNFKISLDIQPVLERDLAYRAGLGWFGKNSMLIHPKAGSFVMLGALLLDQKLKLPVKKTEVDHCGQCRRCIEACPTEAIESLSRTIVAEKCISTWTIELFKDSEPAPAGMENSNGEIFGCDICQDVCPWNERPIRNGEIAPRAINSSHWAKYWLETPLEELIEYLEGLSNKKFSKIFQATPLGRTGRPGLLKNLKFWHQKNN